MGGNSSKDPNANKAKTESGGGVGGKPSVKATASGKPPSSSAQGNLVAAGELVSKKGTIAINARYVTDRPMSDFYQLEKKVVGSGMSGQVLLATCIADKRKTAVKSFKKKGLPTRKRLELKSEVEIYLALDHPHVARLECVFETDEDIFIVMEYMAGGELYDRLSSKKQYNEELAANTTRMMLLAVAYLHAHKIAHRDLKLENFLYEDKESDHLKLIDFGFAKFREHDTKMSQACGSVHYVAPEVLNHSYTNMADMWSLGVIVYMLLTGGPPFSGSDDEVLKKIRDGKPHWSSRFNRLSEPAKKFVKDLLVNDPAKRMSAEQALDHEWMKAKHTMAMVPLDEGIVASLKAYAHASSFRRAVLSMMAWSLSTAERKELRDLFLSIDTENNGTITHSEMKSVLEENFHISSLEAEALFKNLDTDNDNEIAYTEFLAAALQGRVKVHEDLLRTTFNRFDKDSSGKMSRDDLKQILGAQFEGHEIEELIDEADINKDGEIDYEEFIAYFHKPEPTEDDAVDAGQVTLEQAVASKEPEGMKPGSSRGRAGTTGTVGGNKKREQTEKLGALLDTLVADAEKEVAGSPAARGSLAPKPLNRRGEDAMKIGGM